MSHSERLPECEVFQCTMRDTIAKHIEESIPVRMEVGKHSEQILHLNQYHASTMEDIKSIKDDIKIMKDSILGLKIWILMAAVSGLVVLVGIAMWMGGDKKQTQVNTERLHELEEMHPRVTLIGNK
jgi:hypothetical protein